MKHFFLLIAGLQLGAYAHAAAEDASGNPAAIPPAAYTKITARPHLLRDTDIVVRGRVTDVNGEPLIGVNIKSKGTSKGTVTDAKGNYFLSITSDHNVLVFSYVGFITREIAVQKTQQVNVQLAADPKSLNEVVVTALGIKRDEKALGYSATVVKGEQLTEAISSNWTDALSGKVAGVNLVRSNSGPTGSNKIILRGENNLTGENDALIVVDGVVINHGSGRRSAISGEATYGTGSDNMPADYGSGLNDINPEDIESLTVLKGPGAAALYGGRGANGAIIITTKAGNNKRKGIGVSLNSNASVEQVNRWPDLQFEYGQGTDGAAHYSYLAGPDGGNTASTSSAYGPRFEGQMFYQFDPVTQTQAKERSLWKPYTNKLNSYFDDGKTFTNTISLDGGTDKTTARFSVTNVHNTWILPNTGYDRNTVAFSVNSKINDRLQVSSKVNYTHKYSDNLPGAGYGNQSVMYWYIFWQPSADIDWLKNYWENGQEQLRIMFPFSSFPSNPYAVAYEYLNKSSRHGATGNVSATYNITKNLSLQLRTAMDFSYEDRGQQRPYDAGAKFQKGSYRTQNIMSQEFNSDFLLRYNLKFGKDVELNFTAGGSALRNRYIRDEVRADSMAYPGVYSLANNLGPLVTMPYRSAYQVNSFYGMISASYKNFLFADITGRQDWNSVLATPSRTVNSGFFYPSFNVSFVANEVMNLPKAIDFAKLRFSVAGVGSGGSSPYLTEFTYPTAGSLYSGGLRNPSVLANPELLPLRTVTYEAGLAMKMLKSRLGFDLALYTSNTHDQILSRIIDRASGWSRAMINAGKVGNKGIELAVNGTPYKRGKFSWNTSVVYSANTNVIKELNDSSVVLATGPVGGGQIVAKPGGSMGAVYGRGYQRAPDGQVIYDEKTGWAKLTEEVIYLGNTIPKYKIGWTNEFAYGQFRLHLLFDGQFGAVAHSLTHHKLAEQGKTKNTLPGRYNGIVGNGVIQMADGKFRPNDVLATDIDEYYRSHFGQDNAEGSTFSTDFIKFREARLDYSLPARLTKKLRMQKATLGVYGRNLAIWSDWPGFDPEFGTLSGTDIVQGFEVGQFPSTRTIGVNLVIGF